ncbi:MAG TPA: RidA family protein [Steroidobacteraceae bacterium]|nr:RidA family protein [Steroidobacteraceae bacterium]
MHKRLAALAACTLMAPTLMVSVASAAGVVRYPLPGGSTFPIARAVAVPPGYELIFHSGFTAEPANPKAKPGTPEYLGDTKTQTISVLKQIQASLKEMGLSLADVVKMNAFLVGDPAGGRMDFRGFMAGYTQFFGTKEQPNLPARSAVQVAGLASPGALVEIEVVLAKKIERAKPRP